MQSEVFQNLTDPHDLDGLGMMFSRPKCRGEKPQPLQGPEIGGRLVQKELSCVQLWDPVITIKIGLLQDAPCTLCRATPSIESPQQEQRTLFLPSCDRLWFAKPPQKGLLLA